MEGLNHTSSLLFYLTSFRYTTPPSTLRRFDSESFVSDVVPLSSDSWVSVHSFTFYSRVCIVSFFGNLWEDQGPRNIRNYSQLKVLVSQHVYNNEFTLLTLSRFNSSTRFQCDKHLQCRPRGTDVDSLLHCRVQRTGRFPIGPVWTFPSDEGRPLLTT